MATGVDRSKYRNPDMPVGYVKKESEFLYKNGVEIDGIHYIWAPYLYEAHIEERDDYATLSDLVLSDDECILDATILGENGTVSVSKIKTEKSDENGDDANTVTKHGKKGHDNTDTSVLDTSVSQMDIDDKKSEKKKKKKKTTKEHKSGYKSDSSSSSTTRKHHRHHSPSCHRHRSSSSHRHRSSSNDKHEKIVTYSPSPSPPPHDEYLDVKIKQEYTYETIKEEPVEEPQHLFGSYYCEVCNITMTSHLVYTTHVNGRRHRKNMKFKNISEAVAQNIPATVISEDETKYPKPPPRVILKKVHTPAAIQQVLERSIKIPLPGLNHVTEIRGIGDVQYYCSLCDCVCSSNSITAHLTGFKHRLNTVEIEQHSNKSIMLIVSQEAKEDPKPELLKGLQLCNITMILIYFLAWWIENIWSIYERWFTKKERLPTIKRAVLLHSAFTIAKKIRSKKITAEEVVTTYIDRICEVEPFLNTCSEGVFAKAILEAIEIDEYLKTPDINIDDIKKSQPLLGVPFTCCESIGAKDLKQTFGLLKLNRTLCITDHAVIKKLKEAGAILVITTRTPICCFGWEPKNQIHSEVRNPFCKDRSLCGPGGAALVSVGGSILSVSVSIGGSLNMAAAVTGIISHNATPGTLNQRQDDHAEILNNKYANIGLYCRYAKDIYFIMSILNPDIPFGEVNFNNTTVFYIYEFDGEKYRCLSEVKKAVQKAVMFFESKFRCHTVKLEIEELKNSYEIWACKMLENTTEDLKSFIQDDVCWSKFNFSFLQCFKKIDGLKGKDYYKNMQAYCTLKNRLLKMLGENAILILPSYPEIAPLKILNSVNFYKSMYSTIFSTLGFPSTNVPLGFSKKMPFGIQIISTPHQDHLTLAAANKLEAYFGGWKCPNGIEIYNID